MYYCSSCKTFFEKPNVQEYIEETYGPYHRYSYDVTCPNCGADSPEEVNNCLVCGEPCLPSEYFCEDCHDEVKKFIGDLSSFYGANEPTIVDLLAETIEEMY